jgi:hypothetical protein
MEMCCTTQKYKAMWEKIVLKQIYNLKTGVWLLMNLKGTPLLKFSDDNWISDIVLLDMTYHLDYFNVPFQGEKSISKYYVHLQ